MTINNNYFQHTCNVADIGLQYQKIRYHYNYSKSSFPKLHYSSITIVNLCFKSYYKPTCCFT